MNSPAAFHPDFLPMQPDDIGEVLDIETKVHAFPWGRGQFMDSISSGYPARVYRREGALVGYFVAMLAVDEAHLLNIGVAAKAQQSGVGARLLRHAMDISRIGGMKRLLLEVRPSNARALSLYEHYGFRQIGVRRDYYLAEGGAHEDALVLSRDLEDIFA